MKNIIFLDIDGVLTGGRVHMGTNGSAGFGGAWKQFDPVAVAFLNKFAEDYDCQLVLSSTWRLCFGEINKALPFILQGGGLRITPAKPWVTESFAMKPRAQEIRAWIEDWKPDNFIIFDDNADAGYGFEDYFVHTDGMDGMLFRHMERAREIADKWNSKITKSQSAT